MAALERCDVFGPRGQHALAGYAEAVGLMRELDPDDPDELPTDPRSWRYQAAIHGIRTTMPPAQVEQRLWRQCRHDSWYFLPWHRVYLLRFEEVVQQVIEDPSWRLPYWDYSDHTDPDQPAGRGIPPELLWGDAASNPLFRDGRRPFLAQGNPLPPQYVSLDALYAGDRFGLPVAEAAGSFGGGMVTTPIDSSTRGLVENVPHGVVHSAVGGDMGAFATAGLDPLFWLHHCNIDRLWEMWRTNPAHLDPDDGDPDGRAWLTTGYQLFDGAGSVATTVLADVLDNASLGYTYESIEPPFPWPDAPVGPLAAPQEEDAMARMLGGHASDDGIGLARGTVALDLDAPLVPSGAGPMTPNEVPRVYLRVEDVTGQDLDAVSYGVYLNTPEGAAPGEYADRRVGSIAAFGIAEASEAGDDSAGQGLTDVFDATEVVARLAAEDDWDPGHLEVTFVAEGIEGEAVEDDAVRARRVSIYVE